MADNISNHINTNYFYAKSQTGMADNVNVANNDNTNHFSAKSQTENDWQIAKHKIKSHFSAK